MVKITSATMIVLFIFSLFAIRHAVPCQLPAEEDIDWSKMEKTGQWYSTVVTRDLAMLGDVCMTFTNVIENSHGAKISFSIKSKLVGEFKDVPVQAEKLSTGIYTMKALQDYNIFEGHIGDGIAFLTDYEHYFLFLTCLGDDVSISVFMHSPYPSAVAYEKAREALYKAGFEDTPTLMSGCNVYKK